MSKTVRYSLVCVGLMLVLPLRTADDAPKVSYEPTGRYETRTIEGWTVRVHRGFLCDAPDLADETLRLLGNQLFQITRMVPPPAVAKLRTVRIWVERNEGHHPCMAYHPDAGWLRDHDMNPDKAHCVEIANARNFLSWCKDQPWMVLHELAHSYHHQFLKRGFDNSEVRETYEKALDEKLYESCLHINGRAEKAYATTNPMEYFAESSEAYFGTNDFFPYVRSELKKHDPRMFALLTKLWSKD